MTSPATAEDVGSGAVGERYGLSAFGLDVDSDWPLPGSAPSHAAAGTRVRRLSPERFDAIWAEPGERIFQPAYPDGKTRVTVERTAGHYRLWFDGFGRYLVSVGGTSVACEEGAFPRECQERLLFAQALPLAAAIQGFELLHASAVRIGEGVVAFSGPSGQGKTTLASRLVLRGAELVTDDVIALEPGRDELLAHPGPPVMVLRPGDHEQVEAAGGLGPVVGRSDKVHVSVPTADKARPLRRLYYLETGDAVRITPLQEPDLRRVLSSVFAPYLATPGRLQRHLETARMLTAGVDCFLLEAPRPANVDAVLEALEAHLTGLPG